MKAAVSVLKYHPVSDSHGYAIEKKDGKYNVLFVELHQIDENHRLFTKEGQARSMGRPHTYDSIFIADYVIQNEILPLYKTV